MKPEKVHSAIPVGNWSSWSTLALVLVLPWVYLPGSASPAGPPRWLVIQLLLIPGLISAIREGRIQIGQDRVYIPLGLFLGWAGLSQTWATDKGAALIALFHLLTLVQVFLLGTSLPHHRRPQIFRAALVSAGLISVLGSLQSFGFEPGPYQQNFAPAATFLNKNMAAQYLVALLPLLIYLGLWGKQSRFALAIAGIGGLLLFFLVATGARAAWVAALVNLLFLPFLLPVKGHRQPSLKRVFGFALPILAISLILLALPKGQGPVSSRQLNQEFQSLFNTSNPGASGINTVQVRLALYRNSLAMIADNPLKGYGLGNFAVWYPKYHEAVVPTPTFATSVAPEYLHNDCLQVFVELGLPGGILFLWLLYLLVAPALKRNNDMADRALAIALLAILVNSLFSFPLQLPVPALLFWLWAGILRAPDFPVERHRASIGPMLALVLTCLFLVWTYGKHVQASRLMHQAGRLMQAGQGPLAFESADRAVRAFPLDWWIRDLRLTIAARNQLAPQLRDLAGREFLELRPFHANGHFRYGYILYQQQRFLEADASVKKALATGGEKGEVLFLKGLIQEALGDQIAAELSFQRAQKLDPSLGKLREQATPEQNQ